MGWNGSNLGGAEAPKVEAVKKAPSMGKGLLAGLIVVVLAAAAVWFFVFNDKEVVEPTERKGRSKTIAEVKPASRPKADTLPAPKELQLPKISDKRIEKRDGVPELKTLEEMKEELAEKVKEERPKPMFTNAAELLISYATPAHPGARVPPLPQLTEDGVKDDVERAMKSKIQAEDGDTIETLEKKMTVVAAKSEFDELRREGMGFVEYLNAVRDQANADADFMCEVHKMADEIYHDQTISDEDYLKYRDQLNEKLKERGLPSLDKDDEEDDDPTTTNT